jgi:8-oxo-dGTP pyrophosphatase MutT (NUDIX family)
MNNFHYLVRGLYFIKEHVLLAHCLGSENTFLPGGHIHFGEKAADCISRELEEEFEVGNVEVGRFIGAVEHKWEEGGIENYEINLIFQIRILEIAPPTPPISRENHLEFLWARPNQLSKYNLEPYPLIEYILNQMDDERAFWGSTL